MRRGKIKVYLASPYGFTDAGREFLARTMIPTIHDCGLETLDPWESFNTISRKIQKINSVNNIVKKNELLKVLNEELALRNEKMLKKADIVVAILDGPDVDSGVAGELGYAYALGKKIIGYRSDFRVSGDNPGAIVNIQIEHFIYKSGGYIVRKISDLKPALKEG